MRFDDKEVAGLSLVWENGVVEHVKHAHLSINLSVKSYENSG